MRITALSCPNRDASSAQTKQPPEIFPNTSGGCLSSMCSSDGDLRADRRCGTKNKAALRGQRSARENLVRTVHKLLVSLIGEQREAAVIQIKDHGLLLSCRKSDPLEAVF